jgi:hypothetical protein
VTASSITGIPVAHSATDPSGGRVKKDKQSFASLNALPLANSSKVRLGTLRIYLALVLMGAAGLVLAGCMSGRPAAIQEPHPTAPQFEACTAADIGVTTSYSSNHKELMVTLTNVASRPCYISDRFAAILQGPPAGNFSLINATYDVPENAIDPPGTVLDVSGSPARHRIGRSATSFSPAQLKELGVKLDVIDPVASQLLLTSGRSQYLTFGVLPLPTQDAAIGIYEPAPTTYQSYCMRTPTSPLRSASRLIIEFFYGRSNIVQALYAPLTHGKTKASKYFLTEPFSPLQLLTMVVTAPKFEVVTNTGVLQPLVDAASFCLGWDVSQSSLSATPWPALKPLPRATIVM